MDLLASLGRPGPDRPDAVVVAGSASSRARLVEAADALAALLDGVSTVAVEATASLATVVAAVAALRAGVPLVPVAADAGPVERAHVLADSGAELYLRDAGSPPVPLPDGVESFVVDPTATWSGPSPSEPPERGPALILYTSGTTGPPKGVVHSRRALAVDLDRLADAWAWDADDVVVHGLPLDHVHGLVIGLIGPLRVGSALHHTGRPTPSAYAEAVAAGGSLLFGVPTVWSRIAADRGAAAAMSAARLLVSGSAPLSRFAFDALAADAGQRPLERYGMTETLITLSGRHDEPRRPGVVGRPLTGVATRLVDEAGDPLPADGVAIGELLVRGPTLMEGYLGRPDATRSAYDADGWFRTGDAAVVEADGTHRIVGRLATDLIKTGGYRVGAGEVEDALLAHPEVLEAAVVGEPDDDLGQVIVAYVVTDGAVPGDLSGFVADQLATHKRPRRVVAVDALPRNAMGKVRKDQLGRP